MILNKEEREFKTRVWNNLNREWLTEQKKRKREKKEQAKRIKSMQTATISSVAQSMISEGSQIAIEDCQSNKGMQPQLILDN